MDLSPLVLRELAIRLLEEDVGYGDITTLATVPPQARTRMAATLVRPASKPRRPKRWAVRACGGRVAGLLGSGFRRCI